MRENIFYQLDAATNLQTSKESNACILWGPILLVWKYD